MRTVLSAFAVMGVLVAASQVHAAESPTMPKDTPGQQMQSETGPGASQYAPPSSPSGVTPGHEMQTNGPGASEHAPGREKHRDSAKMGKESGSQLDDQGETAEDETQKVDQSAQKNGQNKESTPE